MKEIDPNESIREWVEAGGAKDWQHATLAADLYSMANVMRGYFFGQKDPGQYLMPWPLVAIEKMRVEALASYHLIPNALGLKYQITLNELYLDRPQYSLYESLAHELVHLYMEENPDPDAPKCKRSGYHIQAFTEIAEEIGLHPRAGSGAHWKTADGQFARLMARYAVVKPAYEEEIVVPPTDKKTNWWDFGKEKRRGSSTLKLWLCSCDPPFKVRTGRDRLLAKCLVCDSLFERDTAARDVR